MLGVLNRWLTTYRYRVTEWPDGASMPSPAGFQISFQAASPEQASRRAADIGKKLHILLLGPL